MSTWMLRRMRVVEEVEQKNLETRFSLRGGTVSSISCIFVSRGSTPDATTGVGIRGIEDEVEGGELEGYDIGMEEATLAWATTEE